MPSYDVYRWERIDTLNLDEPDYSYSSSGETIEGTKQTTYEFPCVIEVTTSKAGVVRSAQVVVADVLGCQPYAARIKAIIPTSD